MLPPCVAITDSGRELGYYLTECVRESFERTRAFKKHHCVGSVLRLRINQQTLSSADVR